MKGIYMRANEQNFDEQQNGTSCAQQKFIFLGEEISMCVYACDGHGPWSGPWPKIWKRNSKKRPAQIQVIGTMDDGRLKWTGIRQSLKRTDRQKFGIPLILFNFSQAINYMDVTHSAQRTHTHTPAKQWTERKKIFIINEHRAAIWIIWPLLVRSSWSLAIFLFAFHCILNYYYNILLFFRVPLTPFEQSAGFRFLFHMEDA